MAFLPNYRRSEFRYRRIVLILLRFRSHKERSCLSVSLIIAEAGRLFIKKSKCFLFLAKNIEKGTGSIRSQCPLCLPFVASK